MLVRFLASLAALFLPLASEKKTKKTKKKRKKEKKKKRKKDNCMEYHFS